MKIVTSLPVGLLLALVLHFAISFAKTLPYQDRETKSFGLLKFLSGIHLTQTYKSYAAKLLIVESELESNENDSDEDDVEEMDPLEEQNHTHKGEMATATNGSNKADKNSGSHQLTHPSETPVTDLSEQHIRVARQTDEIEATTEKLSEATDSTDSITESASLSSAETTTTATSLLPDSYGPPASGIPSSTGYGPPSASTSTIGPWATPFPPNDMTTPSLYYQLPSVSTVDSWTDGYSSSHPSKQHPSYGLPPVAPTTDYGPSQIGGVESISLTYLPGHHYPHESWPWHIPEHHQHHEHNSHSHYTMPHYSAFKPSFPDHFRNYWQPPSGGSYFAPSPYYLSGWPWHSKMWWSADAHFPIFIKK